jgi:hypothetical protein
MQPEFSDKIFAAGTDEFASLAIKIFHFQYANNAIYKNYVDTLGIRAPEIDQISKIPFLPIQFFKQFKVSTTDFIPEAIFESSGTTGVETSKHYIKDLAIYQTSFIRGFESFYGSVRDWCIIGLLPSYLERQHSSLVFMVKELIAGSANPDSGFYLHDFAALADTLSRLEGQKQKTLLIGVSFALLDFSELYPIKLNCTIIMETGGMKGRKKEITRRELHERLKQKFGVGNIHAEYGMTELLSQAYSKNDGIFWPASSMRAFVRMDDDPLDVRSSGEGILNIIDLANLYSVSFIATEDMGKIADNGSFEIAGRLDHSEIRGCSQLFT